MSRTQAVCTVCEVHTESTFHVDGMCCLEEVAILQCRLQHLAGLEALTADVLGQRLLVTHDAARLTTATIADAVADTGMRAWLEHEPPRVATGSTGRTRLLVAAAAALALATALSYSPAPPVFAIAAYLAGVATAGLHPARRAWAAIRARHLDINVLMTIAVAGAVILGQWSEAATVVFLFAFAQYLESRSMDRARHAIRALMDLTPPEAVVLRGGREHRVAADEVRPGEIVRIRPGEKVPLDGIVVEGASDVNQAPITGESMPVDKHTGDELFAGSINGRGALQMRSTRHRRDTTLARIIHLVEDAQGRRAPAQAFVERFARVYTPIVIALAALVAVLPPLVSAEPAAVWVYRALVLLVIACPCALVISTPVSIVSALAGAARRGVLFKGGLHLERASTIRCLAFDKTGTLTTGRPAVVGIHPQPGSSPGDVLALAAAVAARSEHPIARAILAHAHHEGLAVEEVSGYTALPGRGGAARLSGEDALLGNPRLFRERGLVADDVERVLAAQTAAGETPVLVSRGAAVVGIVSLADVPRPSAREAVAGVRDHGVRRTAMLTGDNAGAAAAVAAAVGIDDVWADLLPEDKVTAVKRLREAYGPTAMVGDGVNDAPALAAADIGIVMGAAGSDAALETADVALMGDDLSKLPYALRLSRATLSNIRTNVTLAIAVKVVFLALAVTGHATLWMAIAADTGASLLVTANGLRLLKAR